MSSHFEALQSSDVHHVIGSFRNDAHYFQCSLEILSVLASTLGVLQDVLQCHNTECYQTNQNTFHKQKNTSILYYTLLMALPATDNSIFN